MSIYSEEMESRPYPAKAETFAFNGSGNPLLAPVPVNGNADYTPQALAAKFSALIEDMHYQDVLGMFGVGTFQFVRRKLITQEFRCLYVGLWRLALIRSFPDQHEEIFKEFMNLEGVKPGSKKTYGMQVERILQYVDVLKTQGDTDFSEVSRHVLSFMEYDERQTKAMVLKVALHVRRMYVYFFETLV